MARDTEPEKLEEWYNQHVTTLYRELGAFDSDGLFIADGTYLFVPDNPRYEGSQRLLFDEHNHPVSKKHEQAMTRAQQAAAGGAGTTRRCCCCTATRPVIGSWWSAYACFEKANRKRRRSGRCSTPFWTQSARG